MALAAIGLVLLLAACAGPAGRSAAGGAGADDLSAYRLGPGDRLAVVVFGHQDLSGEFEISGAGDLSLPLVGQVSAGGLTIPELQTSLVEILDRDFIVDPSVAIEVLNYRPFYILGQVTRPGGYPYASGLSIRKAVAIAGGFTRRADEGEMTIIRPDPAGGEARLAADPSTPVLPGDTIEVHRRLF